MLVHHVQEICWPLLRPEQNSAFCAYCLIVLLKPIFSTLFLSPFLHPGQPTWSPLPSYGPDYAIPLRQLECWDIPDIFENCCVEFTENFMAAWEATKRIVYFTVAHYVLLHICSYLFKFRIVLCIVTVDSSAFGDRLMATAVLRLFWLEFPRMVINKHVMFLLLYARFILLPIHANAWTAHSRYTEQ
jgi:hypothetical protein